MPVKLSPKELMDLVRICAETEMLTTGEVAQETAGRYWRAYRQWLEEAGVDADEHMRALADPWRIMR